MRCVLPSFRFQISPYDARQFLRKIFNRTMDDASGFRIALSQECVEFLFGDVLTVVVTEWVLTSFS
jgi:hypothetical protein